MNKRSYKRTTRKKYKNRKTRKNNKNNKYRNLKRKQYGGNAETEMPIILNFLEKMKKYNFINFNYNGIISLSENLYKIFSLSRDTFLLSLNKDISPDKSLLYLKNKYQSEHELIDSDSFQNIVKNLNSISNNYLDYRDYQLKGGAPTGKDESSEEGTTGNVEKKGDKETPSKKKTQKELDREKIKNQITEFKKALETKHKDGNLAGIPKLEPHSIKKNNVDLGPLEDQMCKFVKYDLKELIFHPLWLIEKKHGVIVGIPLDAMQSAIDKTALAIGGMGDLIDPILKNVGPIIQAIPGVGTAVAPVLLTVNNSKDIILTAVEKTLQIINMLLYHNRKEWTLFTYAMFSVIPDGGDYLNSMKVTTHNLTKYMSIFNTHLGSASSTLDNFINLLDKIKTINHNPLDNQKKPHQLRTWQQISDEIEEKKNKPLPSQEIIQFLDEIDMYVSNINEYNSSKIPKKIDIQEGELPPKK